jgi:uncharacterized protein (TIGR00369 family)
MDEDGALKSGILPWTRSCFVCGEDNPHGLHLKSRAENGKVVLDYTTRDADLGYRHIVHGGIAMTLLDEVMTWAAILSARRACVAAEFSSRLKKPIEVGQTLRVEAEVTGGRSRLLLTEGRVLDTEGRLLVSASGKYVPMSSEEIELCAADFVASPEAIAPDKLVGRESVQ